MRAHVGCGGFGGMARFCAPLTLILPLEAVLHDNYLKGVDSPGIMRHHSGHEVPEIAIR